MAEKDDAAALEFQKRKWEQERAFWFREHLQLFVLLLLGTSFWVAFFVLKLRLGYGNSQSVAAIYGWVFDTFLWPLGATEGLHEGITWLLNLFISIVLIIAVVIGTIASIVLGLVVGIFIAPVVLVVRFVFGSGFIIPPDVKFLGMPMWPLELVIYAVSLFMIFAVLFLPRGGTVAEPASRGWVMDWLYKPGNKERVRGWVGAPGRALAFLLYSLTPKKKTTPATSPAAELVPMKEQLQQDLKSLSTQIREALPGLTQPPTDTAGIGLWFAEVHKRTVSRIKTATAEVEVERLKQLNNWIGQLVALYRQTDALADLEDKQSERGLARDITKSEQEVRLKELDLRKAEIAAKERKLEEQGLEQARSRFEKFEGKIFAGIESLAEARTVFDNARTKYAANLKMLKDIDILEENMLEKLRQRHG